MYSSFRITLLGLKRLLNPTSFTLGFRQLGRSLLWASECRGYYLSMSTRSHREPGQTWEVLSLNTPSLVSSGNLSHTCWTVALNCDWYKPQVPCLSSCQDLYSVLCCFPPVGTWELLSLVHAATWAILKGWETQSSTGAPKWTLLIDEEERVKWLSVQSSTRFIQTCRLAAAVTSLEVWEKDGGDLWGKGDDWWEI